MCLFAMLYVYTVQYNGHVLVLCCKYTVLQFYYVFRLTKQDIILDLNFCFLQGAMKNLQNIRV